MNNDNNNDQFIEDLDDGVNSIKSKEQRLEEIAIEMQEIEILIEQTDIAMMEENNQDKYMPKYLELNERHKELAQERKVILKGNKTAWDKVPVWMIVYGTVLLLLCFPLLSYQIWIGFANLLMTTFESGLDTLSLNSPEFIFKTVLLLIVYALPLILLLISWIIYVNFIKKDFEKKVFRWIWIIQTIFTVALGIWLYFNVVKVSL